ncbi:MAG: SUMF1/EgtB/PvdO family nonheme iron enzyme [bacterium]
MLTGADRQPLFTPGPDGQLAGLPDQADHPVVLVDHGAVRAYAAWLSARHGAPLGPAPRAGVGEGRPRRRRPALPMGGTASRPPGPARCTRPPGRRPTPPSRPSPPTSPYGVRGLAGNVRDWCGNVFLTAAPEDGAVIDPVVDDGSPSPRTAYLAVTGAARC